MESHASHGSNAWSETFPNERMAEIISELRNSKYKYTTAGRYRTQIKKMPEEYKMEMLTKLRSASLHASNSDVADYLKEIVN